MEKLDRRCAKKSRGKSLAKKRVYGDTVQKPAPESVPNWMKEDINPDTLPVDCPDSEELFESSSEEHSD